MTCRETGLRAAVAAAILVAFSPYPLPLKAQDAGSSAIERALSAGLRFAERSGEELFANICQACHMPDGKGAVGAAAYPALAGNKKLEEAGYPLSVVINGLHSMPSFARSFDDQQIADIVNYIRTNFGNHYKDKVTPEQVKNAR